VVLLRRDDDLASAAAIAERCRTGGYLVRVVEHLPAARLERRAGDAAAERPAVDLARLELLRAVSAVEMTRVR
jgi:hypothetical protein